MSVDISEAIVVACLPYSSEMLGFAQPLLSNSRFPELRLTTEIDEYTQVISGFRAISASEQGIVPVRSHVRAVRGGQQIYAFLSDREMADVGTLDELAPTFRGFIARYPNRTAICLQIAELIGGRQERRATRARMKRDLFERGGAKTARYFHEEALLRYVLWDHLLAGAPNGATAKRILAARSLLKARVNDDGVISVDLSALSPDDVSGIDISSLCEQLRAELEDVILDEDSVEITRPSESHEKEQAIEGLRRISRSTRQEERLAILIDYLIQNRNTGRKILDQYSDRAKYATLVAAGLRTALERDEQGRLSGLDLVRIVQRPFHKGMPGSRAALLFYLIVHLSKYADIRAYLRARLRNSTTYALNPYLAQIEEIFERYDRT